MKGIKMFSNNKIMVLLRSCNIGKIYCDGKKDECVYTAGRQEGVGGFLAKTWTCHILKLYSDQMASKSPHSTPKTCLIDHVSVDNIVPNSSK